MATGAHMMRVERPSGFGQRTATLSDRGRDRSVFASMALFSILGLLVALWAGLAPFIGPSFGVDGDGRGSLRWTLARAVLAVVPAVVGIVGALMAFGSAGSVRRGEARTIGAVGALLVATAGAWLAIGPAAWIPIEGVHYLQDIVANSGLAATIGLSIGPGLALFGLGMAIVGELIGTGPMRSQDAGDARDEIFAQPAARADGEIERRELSSGAPESRESEIDQS